MPRSRRVFAADYVVINDELDGAVERLASIVRAERSRKQQCSPTQRESSGHSDMQRTPKENRFEFVVIASQRRASLWRALPREGARRRSRSRSVKSSSEGRKDRGE